ncbi:MAG: hypothetical protein NT096_00845 [Proteobacteria bacterium]|nr:hypothetical protein [Pseudomonadota bacterium]
MMGEKKKVIIIPCSGIGKAIASVGREAAYEVIENLKPDMSDTVCLSLLVMGDERARNLVRENPVITIDGCPKDCARKNVELSGGKGTVHLRAIDALKDHKDLKPKSVIDIGEEGKKLAQILSEEVAQKVDELLK